MSDRFTTPHEIIQLNIEHYSNLLKAPLDERTRKTVEGLLAAEMAKLEELAKHAADSAESAPADRCGARKRR